MPVTQTLEADVLRLQDPELAEILMELARQSMMLQLIAAEELHLEGGADRPRVAAGEEYAEGYPGARHHGGCEIVDVAERLAVERAKALFGAEHANVQSHSGILGRPRHVRRPAAGTPSWPWGCRSAISTTGRPRTSSGRWFDFVGYGVEAESGLLSDYDQVRTLARAHRPKAIVCGAISYPRHIDYALFRAIADEVGAYLIADAAHPDRLYPAGAAPSPVPCTPYRLRHHAQGPARPPRRHDPLWQPAGQRVDRAVFPFTQGGAQMHTIAAKAVAFGEAATPAFAAYAHQAVANAKVLARLAAEGSPSPPGGPTPTCSPRTPLRSVSTDAAHEAVWPPPEWFSTPAHCPTATSAACAWARPR